jgi:hypothetical protein
MMAAIDLKARFMEISLSLKYFEEIQLEIKVPATIKRRRHGAMTGWLKWR